MSDVTLVIGSYESESLLEACLASAERQTEPPAEVVVVDASSSDGSAKTAGRLGARVAVVPNRGLGALYNEGARLARTPFVLLSNPDVEYERRCFELLAEALRGHEMRFAADPTQVAWADGRRVHGRTVIRRGPLVRSPLPGLAVDGNVPADGVVATAHANAGAMLVRRDRLLALGGFDERFFLEYEDLDLCWRAWLRGWESVHVPEAIVRHHVGGATPPHARTRRLRAGHGSVLRLALKALPLSRAAIVVAVEVARAVRDPKLVVPALVASLRDAPSAIRARPPRREGRVLLDWLLAGQPGAPPANRGGATR